MIDPTKAISIKQPWAWVISEGHKTIETRTWPTQYRGDIIVVSSLKPDKTMLDYLMKETNGKIESKLLYGQALCIADLVDCRLMTADDEGDAMCDLYPGAYSWVLENIRKIKPFKQKGALGIYQIEIPYDFDVMFDIPKD